MSNAVKFSPDGSTVVVDVRPTPPERRALAVPSFEISVTDQGVGISAQDQQSIFEEFYQVGAPARPHGGTGLGLTIVRQFVKLLSGSLTVASSPGQGSTFRVELPTDMGAPPA
ncbi:MAG: sensor histidine kinase [Thermoanaerobaculaceae bacterium]